MLVRLLFLLVFSVIFSMIQRLILLKEGRDIRSVTREQFERIRNSKSVQSFIVRKQMNLRKQGGDIFLRDGLLVSQWYLYKIILTATTAFISYLISVVILKSGIGFVITAGLSVLAWFFLDIYLKASNRQSNEDMMADICEMSRSVLYGKRGGQFIIDAIKDAVIVVENKRLKMGLIKLSGNLDAGRSLEESLNEFETGFSNAMISSFCTVIKSLQSTGQVEEALKTLENNIERGQAGVNKRKCIILENKTMMYVLMIAFDLLVMILYCIIMKLLDMQIAF